MRLSGLKIAVVGGRGYVGSHTAKSLLAAGAEVFIVDNRYVSQNKVAGTQLCGMGNYDDTAILDNLQKKGIDGIVHCAGTSLVGPSVNDPSEYYNNNVIRTIRMLDHLKTWDKPPFIVFSSSAAVYGDTLESPIIESDVAQPSNPYGNTKMMIERILQDYDTAYGIRSYCFRYFNAVGADVWSSSLGPEPGDTHIIPRIFEAYYADKPFELYGTDYNTKDGTCIRDYIHVCDIALAHLTAVLNLSIGYDSRTYNLGTNRGYSNMQILTTFNDLIGDITVVPMSRREGDPARLIANANKFTRQTNWTPEYSDLKTIINSYRDYYEKSKRRI